MRKQQKKVSRILNIIKNHIYNNIKLYIVVAILFLIGIIIGVIFANKVNLETQNNVTEYIREFTKSLKNNYEIDSTNLLKNLIIKDIILTLFMWFMGCTLIGIPIVYLTIVFKGFSFGYTISSIILSLGIGKGSLFCVLSMLLQNIIIIPTIICMAVSGAKVYKSVIKDKRKENVKLEIIRHTMLSICMLILLIFSSIVETYISSKLLLLSINIM